MAKKLLNTFSLSHVMQDNIKELRTVKVYRDSEWEEYIVTIEKNGIKQVNASYHTDSKEDALKTAQIMVSK